MLSSKNREDKRAANASPRRTRRNLGNTFIFQHNGIVIIGVKNTEKNNKLPKKSMAV